MKDRITVFGPANQSAEPIKDPDIASVINSMDIFDLTHGSFKRTDIANQFARSYHGWITSSRLNWMAGLDGYQRYMTFAVTHAIEQWLMHHRTRRFRIFMGEYPGTRDLIRDNGLGFMWIEEGELQPGDAVIISWPFSGSGNEHPMMRSVLRQASDLGLPIMLDCAFYGMCRGMIMNLAEYRIDTIAFSLSKCFAMNFYRIGMIYTNNVPPSIKLLHSRNYVSRLGAVIAMELFGRFSPDYLAEKYGPVQHHIAHTIGDASPSQTVSFLTGGDSWMEYNRGSHGHNRIGIASMLPTVHSGTEKMESDGWVGMGGMGMYQHISRIMKDLDRRSNLAIDMGCGCGVLGILLAKENLAKNVVLSDIDDRAISMASRNIDAHGMGQRIRAIKADAWTTEDGGKSYLSGKFDLMVSILPLAYGKYDVPEGANPARFITSGWSVQRSIFSEIRDAMVPGALVIIKDLANPILPWVGTALASCEEIDMLVSDSPSIDLGMLYRTGNVLTGYEKYQGDITSLGRSHQCIRVLRVR